MTATTKKHAPTAVKRGKPIPPPKPVTRSGYLQAIAQQCRRTAAANGRVHGASTVAGMRQLYANAKAFLSGIPIATPTALLPSLDAMWGAYDKALLYAQEMVTAFGSHQTQSGQSYRAQLAAERVKLEAQFRSMSLPECLGSFAQLAS